MESSKRTARGIYNTDSTWRGMINTIISGGRSVTPRDIKCHELLGMQSFIDMRKPIVTIEERKLGYKFQAAEAYWILTGDSRVETIAPYSKQITKFSDDGIRFQGAYGPKVMEQMHYIVESLARDVHSRQAVLTIWREMPRDSKDIPCTVSLQFFLREEPGKGLCINCCATMRSSDIWLGWPYDVFNFSMISLYVGLMLSEKNLPVCLGYLILTAGSQHLYESNIEKAKICMASEKTRDYIPYDIHDYSSPREFVDYLGSLRDCPILTND